MQEGIDVNRLRECPSELVDEVARGSVSYVLVQDGRPRAVLLAYEEFVRLQRLREHVRERFKKTLDRMAERNSGYSDEEIAAEVEAAIREVRAASRDADVAQTASERLH